MRGLLTGEGRPSLPKALIGTTGGEMTTLVSAVRSARAVDARRDA